MQGRPHLSPLKKKWQDGHLKQIQRGFPYWLGNKWNVLAQGIVQTKSAKW
jgi:hypothetical protein